MRKFVVWMTVISFLAVPLMAQSQTHRKRRVRKPVVVQAEPDSTKQVKSGEFSYMKPEDCETAKLMGAKEGSRETNTASWFLLGLLFPLPGVIIAGVSDPGHPSQYSLEDSGNPTCFEEGYRNKKKSKRNAAALVGAVISVTTALIIISTSDKSSSSGY